MGVHVVLRILPHQISASEWAEAFDETLGLLQRHPARLLRRDHISIEGETIAAYSCEIERDVDTADRRWSVLGDRRSLRTAESQSMYRDLQRYRRGAPPTAETDIVSVDRPGRVIVFDGKTQGEPYHFPVLAAAAVVESRFPGRAEASGDIERTQAERACAWASEVLGRTVPIPVRVDGPRLLARLAQRFEGLELARAFRQAYLGELYEADRVVLETFPAEIAEAHWLEQLADLPNPRAHGSLRQMIAWLDAGLDLERLLGLATQDPRGPRYDAPALVDALAATWLGVPAPKSEFMRLFERSGGDPDTVFTLLGGFMLDREAAGRHLKRRLARADIHAAICAALADEGARLCAAFDAETDAIEQRLDALRPAVESLDERAQAHVRSGVDGVVEVDRVADLTDAQRQRFDLLAFVSAQASERAKAAVDQPELVPGDVRAKRRGIARLLSKQGVVLPVDAWAWIRAEASGPLLDTIIALGLLPHVSSETSMYRLAALANREVCAYVHSVAQDEARMRELGTQVEAMLEEDARSK